jgi:hypothetical protein
MATAQFRIFRQNGHWTIDHDGSVGGEYLSRESAFEVTAAEISNALKVGDGIELIIEEPAPDEPALGTTT